MHIAPLAGGKSTTTTDNEAKVHVGANVESVLISTMTSQPFFIILLSIVNGESQQCQRTSSRRPP